MQSYSGFIDRGFKPSENFIIAEFFLEPAKGESFENAAMAIAAESSVGTWTEVETAKSISKTLFPKVFELDKNSGIVKIAYPLELFEQGNIPQLLSSVAGNVFGMKIVENLKLLDLSFPPSYLKNFKGPLFGISGVRELLEVKERPLCGTIIKPKLGLSAKEHSQVAFQAWKGGIDFVKDDENLTNQSFNKFEERVKLTLRTLERAEFETSETKAYLPNITAETNEMLRRAEFVKESGGKFAMVDIVTVGFSALQTLRGKNEELQLVLHAHRAMHAALTRNKKHGLSMLVLAKIARLIGFDQLHIGTVIGKMQGPPQEVKIIEEEIEKNLINESGQKHVLAENWHHLKPMLAVCSGGLHPALVPKLVKIFGRDIIIQAGGGVHGHSKGTEAGAKALRQAIDAVMQGISLQEFAKKSKELDAALKKWK